jgi:hypothetical protein
VESSERSTLARDLRLFALLGVTAIALLILLAGERAGLDELRAKVQTVEERLLEAKKTVRENRDVLLPPEERAGNPFLLAEKSLRTVVMEASEKVGISRNLEAINPSEDKKNRLVKAQVTLQRVPLRKIVAFIVHLKSLSAGIRDTDATMRMLGYNVDSWKVDLSLEAPRGIARPKAAHAQTKN